jgi:hypothetical protein
VRPTLGLYTCSPAPAYSSCTVVVGKHHRRGSEFAPTAASHPAQLILAVDKWRHPKGDSSRNKGDGGGHDKPHAPTLFTELNPAIVLDDPRGQLD